MYVNILSANKTSTPNHATFQTRPGFFNPFQSGNYNRPSASVPNNPPPNIANNPPPLPSRKPPKAYSETPTSTPQTRIYPEVQKTHLAPIPPLPPELPKTNIMENEVLQQEERKEISQLDRKLTSAEQPVKSATDLTVTLVTVLSVCMIFLIAIIVALAMRKRNCLGSAKNSKDDMVSLNWKYRPFNRKF